MIRSKSRAWRNLALAVAVGSGVVAVWLWRLQGPEGGKRWTSALPVLAAMVSLIAWICVPIAQGDYRRELRLRRGVGVRARWVVAPAQWRAFVDNERDAERNPAILLNLLDIGQRVDGDGVEVIVGNGEFIVGSEYQVVGRHPSGHSGPFWIAGAPPTLEYRFEQIDPNDERVERAFRLPVAAGNEEVARSLCRS